MYNALSVDVEDYFQVQAFRGSVAPDSWAGRPSRVVANTRRLLELLARHRVRATFFVLGWVAEREPALVRAIAAAGHEVACHGYSHQPIYEQSPEVFARETARAKQVLEEQVQRPVLGYRAASWSITRASTWALDIIARLGFAYDSSVFPVRHDYYGLPGAQRFIHQHHTTAGPLSEFPPSTVRLGPLTLPVGGGGYFRLYPYCVTRAGLNRINREGHPFMFYLHPWEIDPQQPRLSGPWRSRLRHYLNLERCEGRLERLLGDFRFLPVCEVLGLTPGEFP